ncbi:LysR substrate-binding domain-containing protein [Aestuariivita boseongensis]|uniref:LysR substrate-binding domain-containing protein n=1 Tax=Aestuariivita boseongensis TaxID=1470562 RepID=UPI001FE1DFE3|nr:LysR substrate-binding domain-containing protein [Aestuariivita boseongensis]
MQWFDDVLTLLEERNMTRAAARRNITQPAFSRRIRSFEEWLGIEVLDRKANRIEISSALATNEGEIRALVARLKELRTKIVHHDATASEVAIAATHAAVFSTFPDMAIRARAAFQGIRFRIRAANLSDCVTLFLRGDTSMLLCYEAQSVEPMPFGAGVRRGLWGHDYLVPVVGGNLRYSVRDNRAIPLDTPAIVYPENSYFGEVLERSRRHFGTAGLCANPICQTAFSSGAKEMILKGLGVGWLPFSMVHREIESGELISLTNQFGQEPIDVAIYAHRKVDIAEQLVEFWERKTDRLPA